MASIPSTETTKGPRIDRLADLGARPAYQAYALLYFTFFAFPLVAGVDKYFQFFSSWDVYLAPIVTRMFSVPAHTVMLAVGVVEICAGAIVAASPRVGGYIVAIWLWANIVNLLMIPGFYDIALRDFALSLGALALANLSREFDSLPRRQF